MNIPTACECHKGGSDGLDCNVHGKCTCNQHVTGDKCEQCLNGYKTHPKCDECDTNFFGYPDCKPCTCNEKGSQNITCNVITGACECKENVTGENCDRCAHGFFGFPNCTGTSNQYQSF